MKEIGRVIKKYTLGIIICIALLAAQAFGELTLPEYTSNIINVGIQQYGIDSVIPNAIRENTFGIYDYLTEDIDLDYYYEIIIQGNEDYIKEYPVLKDSNIYILKDHLKEEELKKLENSIKKAEVFNLMLSHANLVQTNKFGLDAITLQHIMESNEDNALKQLFASIDKIDKSMLEQYSINAVKDEYDALGFSTDDMQMSYLIKMSSIMLVIAFMIAVVLIISCYLSARIASAVAADLRTLVVDRVMSFSNAEFNGFSTASLITRSTNDINQLQMLLTLLLRMILYAPIIGSIALFKIAHIDMAWVVGIVIGIITALLIILLIIGLPKFKIIQKLIDRMNLVVRETLNGLPVIRAFANEEKEQTKFNKANEDLLKTNLFINKMMAVLSPAMSFIMNAAIISIYWVAADKIADGVMQVGTLTALVTYTINIIISFLILSMVSILAPRAIVSLTRIKEVLDKISSVTNKKTTKPLDHSKAGEVEFKNVSFKYPDGEELVLEDLTFKVKKGTTTAIIGSTGCGKSTAINLIPRFFNITGGELLVDGVNVLDADIEELRSVIGVVPQKGLLFSGTVESNIKFADENMSDEQMIRAAQVACADEFINDMPDKYKSEISQGGTNVSGGQRQRLAIARAVAKNPEIYIFDDSFSALDYQTDATVRKNLSEYCKDATKIIVAQRVGTVMNADQIVVLEDGKIVGIGTHKELYKNCKVYKEIALSQLREEELQNA